MEQASCLCQVVVSCLAFPGFFPLPFNLYLGCRFVMPPCRQHGAYSWRSFPLVYLAGHEHVRARIFLFQWWFHRTTSNPNIFRVSRLAWAVLPLLGLCASVGRPFCVQCERQVWWDMAFILAFYRRHGVCAFCRSTFVFDSFGSGLCQHHAMAKYRTIQRGRTRNNQSGHTTVNARKVGRLTFCLTYRYMPPRAPSKRRDAATVLFCQILFSQKIRGRTHRGPLSPQKW